jgi:hypothetical protein
VDLLKLYISPIFFFKMLQNYLSLCHYLLNYIIEFLILYLYMEGISTLGVIYKGWVLLKWWSTRTRYIPVSGISLYSYGTYWSVSVFIWLILDDEYWKNILEVKKYLKIFWFFIIFQLSSLTFHENSWDDGQKKINLQSMMIIHIKKFIILYINILIL